MRTTRYLTLLPLLFVALAGSASSQKARKPVPKPTPVKLTVSPEVSAAKQKVANQLHNVNVFVDRMGPIAVVIENADKDAAAKRLKPSEIEANEQNKKKLIAAISGLRVGLVALETDFRTKPQLSQYLSKIQGISTLCAQSEDSAIAGRFVASKDPLRQVALKLSDTLAVLPGPVSGGIPPATTRSQVTTPPASTQIKASSTQTQPVGNSKREPSLGMTAAEVLESSWGTPSDKRISTSSNGATEVWTYSGKGSIYFFNGKVSNIVK